MMSRISVLEWNIHASASRGWSNDYSINTWIVDAIIDKNCDVVVINEFVVSIGWDYFQKRLKENDYAWFMTYTSKENGILIAIKKEKFSVVNWNDVNIVNKLSSDKNDMEPDFIHIKVNYNNEPLNIIGVRIKVCTDAMNIDEDYKCRVQQFELLCKYLSNIKEKTIVLGDFNNGNIFREYDKNQLYHNCSRQYYNYQMIWREVEEKLKWRLDTPDKGGNYGNKFSIVTRDPNGKVYYTKEDHVISRGCNVLNGDYLWDFMENTDVYGELKCDSYKSNLKYIPDHAMLYAEVEMQF